MRALQSAIPTSRALSAVSTGENVYRETGALPGATLTRVAASHLRVGTFQYFAARRDRYGLEALFQYATQRHFPEAKSPTKFLNQVIDRQAKLVVQWMSVGFIHGAMNTDNTAISGETIDYGPCAFMDVFIRKSCSAPLMRMASMPKTISQISSSGTWLSWPRHASP